MWHINDDTCKKLRTLILSDEIPDCVNEASFKDFSLNK